MTAPVYVYWSDIRDAGPYTHADGLHCPHCNAPTGPLEPMEMGMCPGCGVDLLYVLITNSLQTGWWGPQPIIPSCPEDP